MLLRTTGVERGLKCGSRDAEVEQRRHGAKGSSMKFEFLTGQGAHRSCRKSRARLGLSEYFFHGRNMPNLKDNIRLPEMPPVKGVN